jgi:capsular polysaccharide biosynthesis protein
MTQRLLDEAKGQAKSLTKTLAFPLLRRTRILDYITPDRENAGAQGIGNFQVLVPAGNVRFADPARDPFVPIAKYYRDGTFDRPDIYVCDVAGGYFHVGSGLVCTRDFKAIPDLPYRLPFYSVYDKKKPVRITPRTGLFTTVNSCHAWNHYSWYVDCLARVHSLAQAVPSEPITMIMPDNLGEVMRESLACVLPDNFTLEYLPADTWFQLEHMVWPSLITGRANGFLPPDYYEAIRRPIFQRLGLPQEHTPADRLYVTRRNARCRCVLNEDALVALLERYGFKTILVENLSFLEQVETFHRASVVLGPHGAGLHLMGYSGKIDIVVLHPNRTPQNFFHTLAMGLGQKYHHVLTPDPGDEERNFEVDLAAVEKVLREDLGLKA